MLYILYMYYHSFQDSSACAATLQTNRRQIQLLILAKIANIILSTEKYVGIMTSLNPKNENGSEKQLTHFI